MILYFACGMTLYLDKVHTISPLCHFTIAAQHFDAFVLKNIALLAQATKRPYILEIDVKNPRNDSVLDLNGQEITYRKFQQQSFTYEIPFWLLLIFLFDFGIRFSPIL